MSILKQIVIIGGGVAGVACARSLQRDKRIAVTLLAAQPDFCYRPALVRSRQNISHSEVRLPLVDLFDRSGKVAVVVGAVRQINKKTQMVITATGSYPYDELVIATGAQASSPLNQQTAQSVSEMSALKDRLHRDITTAPIIPSYTVVGGGTHGVELAAAIAQYVAQVKRRHRLARETTVRIAETAPRLLPTYPEAVSRKVTKHLTDLGIRIYTSATVSIEGEQIKGLPGDKTPAPRAVWAIGTTASELVNEHRQIFTMDPAGRVVVDDYLRADTHIWVAGDAAATEYSGYASTAVYDGGYIGRNLQRQLAHQPLHRYAPPGPLTFIVLGPKWCVAYMHSRQLYGRAGWVMGRLDDLRLYGALFPRRIALQVWNRGSYAPEGCESCRYI